MRSPIQPSPQRIAVAHLTPAFFASRSVIGGGERYVSYLAQALRSAAPDHPARFSQTIFSCGERDEMFVQNGIPVRVFRNDNLNPAPMNATAEPLWRELEGFDIVHVHQSLTVFGVFCTAVAKSLRKRVVLTDLGGGEHRLMLAGRGMELADGIISLSYYAHALLAGTFSGPHEILTGPVDTDRFTPSPLPSGRGTRLICVSRILPHKGIDRVIAALPRGLSLTVVGQVYDSGYHDFLRTLAAGKDVTFVHDADDERLIALYREAEVFVQASVSHDREGRPIAKPELMGLSAMEAMSCGLPVVLSDTGSLPELAPDATFGRIFRSDTELAEAFADIAAGLWPPPGAGARARAHVVANYALPAIGARLGRFYADIHGGRACAS
jgi:glycosyltransferase involved in cell wall biosynthesis